MQLREFKIRASAVSLIMTGQIGLTEAQENKLKELDKRDSDSVKGIQKPLTENMRKELIDLIHKKENPKLGETCISYLQQWVKEQIYGVKKEIKSKYLTKGLDVEDIAIDYYSEEKGLGFVLKNDQYFKNDFCHGTPDLIYNDIVYDFKSSWDCFTFPLFDTEPDKLYWMQLQIYMHLTHLKKAKLVYTLQNTPDELEWDEPKDYSELSSKYRIKEFDIEYNDEFIKSVENRVLLCREYIKELLKNI